MRSLRNYDQSSLWKRLDELSRSDAVDRAAVDHLKSSVHKPVDGELIRPGWVREPHGREEELRVMLDWGTDDLM